MRKRYIERERERARNKRRSCGAYRDETVKCKENIDIVTLATHIIEFRERERACNCEGNKRRPCGKSNTNY